MSVGARVNRHKSRVKNMSKLEMIKKLEYLVAFQANCLEKGNWDEFDKLENSIKSLEKSILKGD